MNSRIKFKFYILMMSLFWNCNLTTSKSGKLLYDLNSNIGTKQFIWEDSNRQDEYYGESRLINVQVWYPSVDKSTEKDRTSYLLFEDKLIGKLDNWTQEDFKFAQKIKLNSFNNLPFQSNIRKLPLLIFSPSLGGNLSYYTYYAEFFAKKGYIVMGINHLYESEVVIDKDSNIFPANHKFQDSLKSLKIPEEISAKGYRETMGKRQKIIAEDIVFALNKLLDEQFFKNKIDINRIAVLGHSLGGAAAIYSSLIDNRIKAVINFDGTPPSIALEKGIDIPFLFIEDLTDFQNHQGHAKMHERRNNFCKKNRADSWRILIDGFNHNSFLDVNYYFTNSSTFQKKEKENLNLIIEFIDVFLNSYINGISEMNRIRTDINGVKVIRFTK